MRKTTRNPKRQTENEIQEKVLKYYIKLSKSAKKSLIKLKKGKI